MYNSQTVHAYVCQKVYLQKELQKSETTETFQLHISLEITQQSINGLYDSSNGDG